MNTASEQPVRVGISIGDPNGIGLEVILKGLSDRRMLEHITPVIYGSSQVVSYHQNTLGLKDLPVDTIEDVEKAKPGRINLLNCWEEDVKLRLGKESRETGKYAILSFKAAVEDLANSKADVLVTAPFSKHAVQSDDFDFPGHTEYLARYSNMDEALMFMVSEGLRVGVVTGHVPLEQVPGMITEGRLTSKLELMLSSLERDIGIRKPKVAVLGLNPHAGDHGLLGRQEKDVIIPVLERMREQGHVVNGPFPADGFFGSSELGKYDGVLAMYHDQGLAPFKALSFDRGVNFTAGLPVIRTAPDHGTAFNIAGKDQASPTSFRNAVLLACDIFEQRRFERAVSADPLQSQKGSPYMKQ